ncbi:MAG: OmcA/MtrC family decaheme c-type cytochrome [Rubrivivax sp.]
MQVPSNTITNAAAVAANAQTWATMEATLSVTGVSIASPPVVNFKVTDGYGRPVVGLGNTSKAATAPVASYPNLAFALAKLVPGTNGSPSRWVSYIVTTVPTTAATSSCATGLGCPGRPTTDNTGTLVDNGDGSYKYTFYRDVPGIKAAVASMAASAAALSANNKVVDLGDLAYDPNATHRLTVVISGAAPGTGTNTPTAVSQGYTAVNLIKPVNVIYDFIPATGKPPAATDFQREIASNAKCEACHGKLGGIPGLSLAADSAAFHGSTRNDVRYCVVCHTEQRKYGQAEATFTTNGAIKTYTGSTTRINGMAVGNLPVYIHRIHAGELLQNRGYNYAGLSFVDTTYPQDLRNCDSCHDGSLNPKNKTAQGDNWKTQPSAVACGSCHDGINFATGTGVTMADAAAGKTSSVNAHPAGALPDDSQCGICHKTGGLVDTDVYHLPITPPDPGNALLAGGANPYTNSAWLASNAKRVPAGAIVPSYDVKSVTRDAAKHPQIVFRLLQNGARKDLNDFATAAVNPATGDKELWDGFMGAPSAYFVWAQGQDGIAAPADFNVAASAWLKMVWKAGKPSAAAPAGSATLTGPDANGYYTLTMLNVVVPDTAVMLSGGLGYDYTVTSTQPLTQTNLANFPVSNATAAGQVNKVGGLVVVAPNAQVVATGYTGRRPIVENARCNACHQLLGPFTDAAFHAGQRNDGTTCSWCHTPNKTSSGWSADSANFVHAIHGSAKRTVPYNWHASATSSFADVTYPGVLNKCETCHLPGTYDFSATASANAAGLGADGLDKRQNRTVASGTFAAPAAGAVSTLSPYVQTGVAYGSIYSVATATGNATEAAPTTLVMTPTTAVCVACHDSTNAVWHYRINGGSVYDARSVAATQRESCFVCHAPGRVAAIAEAHRKP